MVEIYSDVACECMYMNEQQMALAKGRKREKGEKGGCEEALLDTLADILNNATAAEYAAPIPHTGPDEIIHVLLITLFCLHNRLFLGTSTENSLLLWPTRETFQGAQCRATSIHHSSTDKNNQPEGSPIERSNGRPRKNGYRHALVQVKMEPLPPRERERDGEQNTRLREDRERGGEGEGERMRETDGVSKTKKQNTFSWHCGKADAVGT
ncbi:uncharacterized protein LOC105425796 [Pogonomyrmex barbatus]|uniref:Uncharacterized protein LOC105425796 n=1 Tax=Pogonomyrmex barbatus TaxID=144034 RepID=A0A6I9W4N7_9HYME|nr:uncharacterized protein LOC105425796 [Pogonomyrmex barbatus]